MIIPTRAEMIKANIDALEIEKMVDYFLLQNSGYEKIFELIFAENLKSLIGKNQDIYILHIMARIVEWEISQNVEHTLFEGRNARQIIRVYRILSLYLRRIEFDFPYEYKKEIVDYIVSEKISMEALLAVIKMNNSIICKEKVTEGLHEILSEIITTEG